MPAAAAGEDDFYSAFLIRCVAYAQTTQSPDQKSDETVDRSACLVCQTQALGKNLLPAPAIETTVPWSWSWSPPQAPLEILNDGHTPLQRLPRGPPAFV